MLGQRRRRCLNTNPPAVNPIVSAVQTAVVYLLARWYDLEPAALFGIILGKFYTFANKMGRSSIRI